MNKKSLIIEIAIVLLAIAILCVSVLTLTKASEQGTENAVLEELQSKIDAITGNLGNQDALGLEDFKSELSKQLSELDMDVSSETIASAVETALTEYGVSKTYESVSLTEAQIQLIVTRVLAGSLTAEQMETIVRKNSGGSSSLTASQIQRIVDNAMAKTLTAAQVKLIVETELASVKSDLVTAKADLAAIQTEIAALKSGMVTAQQLEDIVKKYVSSVAAVPAGADLGSVIADVVAASSFELEGNVVVSENLVITKDMTIDTASFDVEIASGKTITVDPGVTLTLIGNGSFKADGRVMNVAGDAVIESGTFVGGKSVSSVIAVVDGGSLTINGGAVAPVDPDVYYGIMVDGSSSLVINDGTFTAPIAVSTNATSGSATNCVINGGTFKGNGGSLASESEPLIYWPTGTLTIKGGTFEAPSTVLALCGGKVELLGGTFKSTGAKIANFGGNSGSFSDGSLLSVITNRSAGYSFGGLSVALGATLTPAAGQQLISVYGTQADFAAGTTSLSNKWPASIEFAAGVADDLFLPASYVDFEFTGGAVTDAKGNVTITEYSVTVAPVEVTAAGKTKTVDALTVQNATPSAPSSYVLAQLNDITTQAEMQAFAQNGFAVEAFYLMDTHAEIQGVVCATEKNGGFGIAQRANRTPYFITGTGSGYTYKDPTSKASATELVHVLAVYDFAAKQQRTYVNGKLESTVAITAFKYIPDAPAFNKFCLGGDTKPSGLGGDFGVKKMVMVDAKIYNKALSSSQVAVAYDSALSLLD